MFQLMLFVGSIIAFIIGGLIVLIGLGAITGIAAGLVILFAGGIISLISLWSVVRFLLPSPESIPASSRIIDLVPYDGTWI